MNEKRFTVTTEHIILLSHLNIGWDDMEYGAPCVDPKRPYGNGDAQKDIYSILGWEKPCGCKHENCCQIDYDDKRAKAIHKEMETALQILVRQTPPSIEVGEYVADQYRRNWRRA